MAFEGTNFAGAVIEIDSETVGKITSWTKTVSVTEEQVSGSEDTIGTAPNQIIKEKYRPVSQGITASCELIYLPDNTGQNDLETAAEAGTEVALKHTDQNGYGTTLTGFFTNFEKTGSLDTVYTATADFRSNSESDESPAS